MLAAAVAAGCGGPGGSLGANPSANAFSAVAHPQAVVPAHGQHKYAGTYNGTLQWSTGSEAVTSAPLVTIVRFHNKNILGPFRFTFNSQKHRFRLYGRVKLKSDGVMHIAFLIYNTAGGYATGNGTITNGTFVGKAKLAPGAGPGLTLSFTANKTT